MRLTPNQVRGFGAAWAFDAWTLIYALLLVPGLRELLPDSGIAPTTGALGDYGAPCLRCFWLTSLRRKNVNLL
jgi:hypothetical protein